MMTLTELRRAHRTWWRPIRTRRALLECITQRNELARKSEHLGAEAEYWMERAKDGKPLNLARFAVDEPDGDGITKPLVLALQEHLLAIGQSLTRQARSLGGDDEARAIAGGWAMKNYLASLDAAFSYMAELYETFRTPTEPAAVEYRRIGDGIGREEFGVSNTSELAEGIKSGKVSVLTR